MRVTGERGVGQRGLRALLPPRSDGGGDTPRAAVEGTSEELKRRIPGGHVRLTFADEERLGAAMGTLRESARETDTLALRVPNDGATAGTVPRSGGS